jgi:hypothetical protein
METTVSPTATGSRRKSAAPRQSAKESTAASPTALANYRPALLARFRDLTQLRYDYPLVLLSGADGAPVRSLSGIVNNLLQQAAPKGIGGERMRKNVLNLETRIRSRVAGGERTTLSRLWDQAAAELLATTDDGDAREKTRANLERARSALRFDGEVLDCDQATPSRLITHARNVAEARRSREVRREVGDTVLRLSDILDADSLKSNGRRAAALKAGVGSRQDSLFDFDVMSKILVDALPADQIPAKRRKRIEFARSVLQSQKFFAAAGDGQADVYPFVFDSCAKALEAFRARLPAMADFVKALRIADLELVNRYKEERHDAYFDSVGPDSLDPDDVAVFPSYLVCLNAERMDDTEFGRIVEILISGLPIKVLIQTDDVVGGKSLAGGLPALGGRGAALARMAVNLGRAYVLQATSSNLGLVLDEVANGIRCPGPAVFSVLSGAGASRSGLPPYLVAAAALESRVFPAFVFDPNAGPDLADRFSVAANPAADQAWAVADLLYEDPDLQRVNEQVAFTPVDLLACDVRFAECFTPVDRAEWTDAMAPAAELLGKDGSDAKGRKAWIWMTDADNQLRRVTVTDLPLHIARACAETWRGLQELGGIESSHARRLLAQERQSWEEQKQAEIEELKSRLQQEAPAAPVAKETVAKAEAAPAEVPKVVEAAPSPDEAYIETPRCTSCNECITKNNRMFAYNENKQAFIKDVRAGTYRDLVEAAEKCQLAIIHPGKPVNLDEPNLEALMERAAAFK